MTTRRLISNISYNTDAFLAYTMKRLVDERIIDYAYWIYHEPDTDDTKRHAHIVLKPSKTVDTADLKKEFDEMQSLDSGLLGVTSVWRTSDISNWLFYALHDRIYLASKCLTRKYHYDIVNVQATDRDALLFDYNQLDRSQFERFSALSNFAAKGIPFAVLVQSGIIPIQLRAQYESQYNALCDLSKSGHPINLKDYHV